MTGVSVLFQVVISDVHGGYFQGAGGTNYYPLFRAFYNLHLDVCFVHGQSWNESKLTLASFFQLEWGFCWPFLLSFNHIMTSYSCGCWKWHRNLVEQIIVDSQCQEVMKSVECSGTYSDTMWWHLQHCWLWSGCFSLSLVGNDTRLPWKCFVHLAVLRSIDSLIEQCSRELFTSNSIIRLVIHHTVTQLFSQEPCTLFAWLLTSAKHSLVSLLLLFAVV